MNQLKIVCLYVSFLLISSCCKEEIADNVPGCIKRKICAEIKNDSKMDRVVENTFNGATVYSMLYTDYGGTTIKVYDSHCDFLCSLYIGSTFGLINDSCSGTRFSTSAVFRRNVWEK